MRSRAAKSIVAVKGYEILPSIEQKGLLPRSRATSMPAAHSLLAAYAELIMETVSRSQNTGTFGAEL